MLHNCHIMQATNSPLKLYFHLRLNYLHKWSNNLLIPNICSSQIQFVWLHIKLKPEQTWNAWVLHEHRRHPETHNSAVLLSRLFTHKPRLLRCDWLVLEFILKSSPLIGPAFQIFSSHQQYQSNHFTDSILLKYSSLKFKSGFRFFGFTTPSAHSTYFAWHISHIQEIFFFFKGHYLYFNF